MSPEVGSSLVEQLSQTGIRAGMADNGTHGFDVVIITAGYFATEDFETGPKWEEEVKMYSTPYLNIAPGSYLTLFIEHL